jgi:hypothetical protein
LPLVDQQYISIDRQISAIKINWRALSTSAKTHVQAFLGTKMNKNVALWKALVGNLGH